MTSRALEQRNRERAILRAIWNRPLIARELVVTLRSLEQIPDTWTERNVLAVLRRLHRAGKVSRLDHPAVTSRVLWWAH